MEKEKTILEWLETAPDEWRDKALTNIKANAYSDNQIKEFVDYYSLADVLSRCFIWQDSQEGFVYWRNICNSLQD